MGNDEGDGQRPDQRPGQRPDARPAGSVEELASGPEPQLLFGGGVVLGAVVLALVWAFVSVLGHDAGGGTSNPAVADVGGSLIGSAPRSPQSSLRDRCIEAAAALRGPLGAAEPAMDQWAVHIGAMNKLVTGAISLSQATAFWNQTRRGAHQHIQQFHRSLRTLREEGLDCPPPGRLPTTADEAARSCSSRVDADLRAVTLARTAIDTWERHVRDMERLRTGRLSPADASRMWLQMWQEGQGQLDRYRAAARAARAEGCTLASAPSAPSAESTPPAPSASMDMPGMS